ncbi:5-(carboxyamino)imidazole ribonucleotide mutase [Candidatus Aerophobetes bacterium]|nr:5-(carboxyamino)imidazole ribonucleotide mutase [Candidatus Aerophobetes bacterium]
MPSPLVSVVMGSESDMPVMKRCIEALQMFGVELEVRILSAHRMPDETVSFSKGLEKRGVKVVIAGAGGAAHLPGVIAAHTTLPVVGIPLSSTPLQGIDALYSIVQMPSGVPVACMGIGESGAFNAAIFALEIISCYQESLGEKLKDYRKKLAFREKSYEKNKN